MTRYLKIRYSHNSTIINWITLKILLLVLYSGFGTFALKRGKTKQIHVINFALVLLCIGVIFVLALSKLVL